MPGTFSFSTIAGPQQFRKYFQKKKDFYSDSQTGIREEISKVGITFLFFKI